MADIEMDDMTRSRSNHADENTEDDIPIDSDSPKDGVISLWAWTSTGIILLFALALILFPRVLLFAAESSNEGRTSLSNLESFLALHFGILLVAVATALILNVPSTSQPGVTSREQPAPDHPFLVPLTGASLTTAFLSYNTVSVGPLAFILFMGSAIIGVWGLWAIIFAGSSLVSKKTGADKHTSAFLFGNKKAASIQKKRWKKEQKGKFT